jgi:hypothetical protein
MGEPKDLSPSDILRGIQLIRSADPAERKRGIHILMAVRHDPRVLQVFERLYEDDLDPSVRREAWHALTQAGPAVPGPKPVPVPQAEERPSSDPAPAPNPATTETPPAAPGQVKRVLFLLDPVNARLVAREARRIARRRRTGRIPLALAALLLLLAAVVWGLVLPDWLTWYRLRQDGVSVAGQITGLQVHGGDRYYADYRFEVGQGSSAAPHTGEQRITQAAYERLKPSAPVTVTYLPGDPQVSRLDASDPADRWRARLTLGAGGLTVLFVGLALLGLDRRRQSHRAAHGWRVLRGQVVECGGRLDQDGDFKIRLRYRFLTPDEQVIVGQTSQIRNDLNDTLLPQPGAPVAVYYLRDGVYRLL